TLERGAARWAPAPTARSRAAATRTATRVAREDGIRFVSPDELTALQARRRRDNLHVLDVRTADEYAAGHVAGAVWAPGGQVVQATDAYARGHVPGAYWLCRSRLEWTVGTVAPDRRAAVVVTCADGFASTLAAATLTGLGYAAARVLDGGTRAWTQAGLAVEDGGTR